MKMRVKIAVIGLLATIETITGMTFRSMAYLELASPGPVVDAVYEVVGGEYGQSA